jgi:hypothetical protein
MKKIQYYKIIKKKTARSRKPKKLKKFFTKIKKKPPARLDFLKISDEKLKIDLEWPKRRKKMIRHFIFETI